MSAFRSWSLVGALAMTAGCAREAANGTAPLGNALRGAGASASADPTVRGARIVPEAIDDNASLGLEPGGGVRGIAGGVRYVSLPNGAVLAADDRFPAMATIRIALPERLGGGFLFVLGGNTVWRADRWLAPAHPIFTSALAIARVMPGLDRVYVRATNAAIQAIDARTGAVLDLGPWPGSSFVGGYAAVDGWRALAIDDLRGVVATFDAGATWRPLALPIDAHEAQVAGDAIVVGGQDANHAAAWFEVRGDGQVGRLSSPPPSVAWGPALPPVAPALASLDAHPGTLPLDSLAKPFGKRPLVAAIEDGWPLSDRTALVARDGVLGRIRLDDGALIEAVADAYPLKRSRCHPIPLASGTPGAFGFVCGELHGTTAIYAYDAKSGRMVETRRWSEPRAVLSSGNGAIAVRGRCAPEVDDDSASTRAYCTRSLQGVWRQIAASETDKERLVVLADGRHVLLTTPVRGDLKSAHLTIAGDTTSRVAVRFPQVAGDLLHVLTMGVWLDGFEERRPGVLGGWIEAGGSMLGVEIALDGHVRVGTFIRDAGAPMVAGRYGLGWTASRRGYETIDGGMTWTSIDVPEQRERPNKTRACGPIGCSAEGWLRVGWGPLENEPTFDPPVFARPPVYGMRSALTLTCESTSPLPKAPRVPRLPSPPSRSIESLGRGVAPALAQPLPSFYDANPPDLRSDERAVSYEASELLGRHGGLGPLGRVYGWGPRSGEWEHASRWVVRWLWPYGGANDVRSAQIVGAPKILLDAARFGGAAGTVLIQSTWTIAPGDDPNHALLIARRTARGDAVVYELEADKPPVEVARADGDPFTEIDSALRAGGRWYIATPPAQGDLMAESVWQVEGAAARELARIPRAGMDARPTGARLARRNDGRAIGLVVDGQPSASRPGPQRWVLPIDLDTGATFEPEALGAADLGDRTNVALCTDDFAGWVIDTPLTLPVTINGPAQSLGALASGGALARVRVSKSAACVERIAGTLAESYVADHLASLAPSPAHAPLGIREGETSISVSLFAARTHHALRCVSR